MVTGHFCDTGCWFVSYSLMGQLKIARLDELAGQDLLNI